MKVNGHVVTRSNKRHREFLMATGEMTDQQFEHFLTQALRNVATNAFRRPTVRTHNGTNLQRKAFP